MAMIDYGAIAFKNGKLISTDMFTPMKDMVGWEDSEHDTYHDFYTEEDRSLCLKGNYFAYIGDQEYTVAFYKCTIVMAQRIDDEFRLEMEILNSSYYIWSKWEHLTRYGDIIVTKRNGYYVCRWNYKGDKYKVYFGYGVDFNSYKKWHIVNYYRSIPYLWNQLKWNLEKLKWKIEKIISNRRTKWK